MSQTTTCSFGVTNIIYFQNAMTLHFVISRLVYKIFSTPARRNFSRRMQNLVQKLHIFDAILLLAFHIEIKGLWCQFERRDRIVLGNLHGNSIHGWRHKLKFRGTTVPCCLLASPGIYEYVQEPISLSCISLYMNDSTSYCCFVSSVANIFYNWISCVFILVWIERTLALHFAFGREDWVIVPAITKPSWEKFLSDCIKN